MTALLKMATVHNVILKVAAIFLYFVAFSSARKFPDFVDALTHLQSLNNWNDLEWVWSASYDHEWLQSVVRNDTLRQFSASGMSLQCLLDLGIWAEDLVRRENWAIQSQ